MPLLSTFGAASARSFGGIGAAAAGAGLDVDEVFSTYLYDGTGTGSNLTVTNNIDLSTEGGLVWVKRRDASASNSLFDTVRGQNIIESNSSGGQDAFSAYGGSASASYNTNGFGINGTGASNLNSSSGEYVSWTFRKSPKFFDIVTYSGTGSYQGNIAHNLGTSPGMIIVKRTDSSSQWVVWHRNTDPKNLQLNGTAAASTDYAIQDVTSTKFGVTNYTTLKASESGASYVAYLFAHNNSNGEFGPGSDQDIIKCGSYTGNQSTQDINLGFEPQWIMIKASSTSGTWYMWDNMRGVVTGGDDWYLRANDNSDESDANNIKFNSTGFSLENATVNANAETYIYMAIRRGPLAAPTDATKVFAVDAENSSAPYYTSNFPVDMGIRTATDGSGKFISARITGTNDLRTDRTNTQDSSSGTKWDYMDGYRSSAEGNTFLAWMWKRAPGYFDVVAYTGDGGASTLQNHNLGVVPEMIWIKGRDSTGNWGAYHKVLPSLSKQLYLNLDGSYTTGYGSHIPPTATQFCVGGNAVMGGTNNTNASNGQYIAYLFATAPGVSKVGSFTQGSSSQTIDCGFSSGARFVLIKRTDGTNNWLVFDSVRGIVSGNDPFLKLDNTNAEETNDDIIDSHSSGFIVNTVTDWTENGQSFIFYAIA